MINICISCGMPMEKKEHFSCGDESKNYCSYCTREDGSMQSYEEKFESLKTFITNTQGLKKEEAESKVKTLMKNLPAWKNYNI